MLYTVRAGDTLAEIGRRSGVPLSTLVQFNEDIDNINQIYIGHQIYILDEEIEPMPLLRPVQPDGIPMPLPRLLDTQSIH